MDFPLQINLAKAIPALAAGCTVVLKLRARHPVVGVLPGRVAAGNRPGSSARRVQRRNLVRQGGRWRDDVDTDPRIDVASFTGSTQVGDVA
ncbi:aldehyde dehydrogenase family protein [Sphingomonas sp. MMS24-JH45]